MFCRFVRRVPEEPGASFFDRKKAPTADAAVYSAQGEVCNSQYSICMQLH